MAKYKINIINNARKESYANPLRGYVQRIAQKYKFDVDVGVVHHRDVNNHLRKHKRLAKKHIANGYIGSGGEGSWTPRGDKHSETSHPYMKRSNRVYKHLIENKAYVHGVCEAFKALAQEKGAYSLNSGKMNINKEEGLHHKYLVPAEHKGKLRNAAVSKNKHRGHNYVTGFEEKYSSGTQHHPEKRQSKEDEETIVRFLEKVTGKKREAIETLEKKVQPNSRGG